MIEIASVDALPDLSCFEITVFKNPLEAAEELNSQGYVARGRSDLPAVLLKVPIAWGADEHSDPNWMYQLHAWRHLDVYFNLLAKGKPLADEALSQILLVVEDWYSFNVAGAGCPWTWYDMSTGIRGLKLAYLLVASKYFGTDEKLRVPYLSDLLGAHVAHLANSDELNPGNHGLFQLNGLMALAWALPDWPGREGLIGYCSTHLKRMLRSQFGEVGVHREHSPSYHFFVYTKLKKLLEAPWWHSIKSKEVTRLLRLADLARYWLVSPDSRCVPIGDSTTSSIKLRSQSRLYRWPYYTRNGNTIGARLDGYGIVRSTPDVTEERSSYLLFQTGFFQKTHKHADCLSFVWQEAGEYLLIDSGKYGYMRDRMRRYIKSTRAHNTVEIDGQSYSIEASKAYGVGLRELTPLGQGWMLSGRVLRKDLGHEHERRILFMAGWLVVVIDRIVNLTGEARQYSHWWHFNQSHSVDASESSELSVAGLRFGRFLVAHFRTSSKGMAPETTLARGQEEPELLGWVSNEYRKCIPTTTVGFHFRTPANSVISATVFEVLRPGRRRSVEVEISQDIVTIQAQRLKGMFGVTKGRMDFPGYSVAWDET